MDFINSETVTKEELLQVAVDLEEHHESEGSVEVVMYCIAERYKNQPRKAGAVYMRMQALARYVGHLKPRGWTLPEQTDGAIPTQEAVFAAAAVHPLIVVDNELDFEPVSFAARILEMAETEGRA